MADEPGVTSSAASRDKAFEIFVKRTINSIQKEAWGRSKEVKEIREACQAFLNRLDESGCSEETLKEVLHPLGLACSSSMQKIVDLALGCLHKLVAHAWLQGESTPAGSMDMLSATGSVDGDDTVAQVIKMVIKCGETNNEALQLAVVRALLTFTTAEHFVAHGECLLAAVRTVFNLALGSDNAANKRTACNALLQMLNTIAKRVTQIQPRLTLSDGGSSRAASDAFEMLRSFGSAHSINAALSPKPSTPLHGGADDGRAAQFASLAEKQDLRGLEAALEAGVPPVQEGDEEGPSEPGTPLSPPGGEENDLATPLPSTELQPQASVGRSGGASGSSGGGQLSAAAVQAAAARSAHRTAKLSTNEKDVLLVLTAFCKLASREAGASSTESYLHQGKLLALELLSKVLQNPVHAWDHVREPFCRHLRQPLCIALLRNCAAADPTAFQLAVALLGAILNLPRLRLGLRAELGAFYPLLVLRPLEQEAPDPANLATALGAIQGLAADPRLLVDVFVNYDCDLQAPNLYERTMQCLGKLAQQPDPEPDGKPAERAEALQRAAATRAAALRCLLDALASLDAWAAPLKAANQRAVDAQEANNSSDRDGSSGREGGGGRDGSGGDGSSARGDKGSAGGAQGEVERFGAAKSVKEALQRGLALFNGKDPVKGLERLIADGLVKSSPQAAAEFLRKHASSLDKAQLGELFGHHSDFAIAVMHAWIDTEGYEGLPIDGALRQLLEQFRLPGEAQKIDRIMEKFAERYCRDNPSKFRNADAAYMLAFAIIMLNTDAHNPMAERRLGKQDFVAMAHQQTDEGLVPILPQDQVEAIYDRIVAAEILVRDEPAAARGAERQQQQRNRLAAALGWARKSGWDKQRGADAERRAMMEMAEREMARGALGGNVWHAAQHAEHVRPMLQASGRTMLDAMATTFMAAPDAASAARSLQGLVCIARLAALLGLDELCEAAVAVLAAGAGAFEPAPYASPAEQKQLAALRALLSLPAGPEAALLGSSWALVLRTASALEALRAELTRPQQPQAAAKEAAAAAAAAAAAGAGNAFSRMFQNVFRGNAARPEAPEAGQLGGMIPPVHTGSSGGSDPMEGQHALPVREAPGASLVLWAQSEGRAALESVYARSVMLDGDGIVVFMRALCAISQEELEGRPPRLHSLTKMVECAHANTGRIRLVWTKLWSVIAAQLVGAACHPDARVASYAVESLRQLVAKLLSRAELPNFTHQEEALRPFAAVLKQCDEVGVRELAVQCVMQAVAAHPRGLGSGWRQAIEALRAGAADPAPAVMAQAQESLQVVVEALYQDGAAGEGHECLRECVRAIVAGVSNQGHQELSVSAVGLLARVGARLAAWEAAGHVEAPQAADPDGHNYGWGLLLRTLADILQHERRQRVANAALEVLFSLLQDYGARWDERGWRILLHRVLPHMFTVPTLPNVGSVSAGGGPEGDEEGGALGPFLERVDRYFPQLCAQTAGVPEEFKPDLIRQLTSISLSLYRNPSDKLAIAGLHAFLRLATTLQSNHSEPMHGSMLAQLQAAVQEELAAVVAMAQRMRERAQQAPPPITGIAPATPPAVQSSPFGTRLLEQHMGSGSSGGSPHSPALRQLPSSPFNSSIGGGAASSGYQQTAAQVSNKPALARSQGPWVGELQLYRTRTRLLVLMQRALSQLHKQAVGGLPWQVQGQLLDILASTVEGAMRFNAGGGAGSKAQQVPGAELAAALLARKASAVSAGSSLSMTGLVESGSVGSQEQQAMGASAASNQQHHQQHQQQQAGQRAATNGNDEPQHSGTDGAEGSPSSTTALANGTDHSQASQQQQGQEQQPPQPSQGQPQQSQEQQAPPYPQLPAIKSGGPSSPGKGSGGSPTRGSSRLRAVSALPQLLVSSAESLEVVRPALMRLEAEGGLLLLQGLLLSLDSRANASSRAAIEQKLRRLCRDIISCAADSSTAASSSGAKSAAAEPPEGSTGPAAGGADNPLRDALCGTSWEHAVCAPLVVRALEALGQLHGDDFKAEVLLVFPSLARLACSSHLMVRQALYRVLAAPEFAAMLVHAAQVGADSTAV